MCILEPPGAAGQGLVVGCCGYGDAGKLCFVRDGLDIIGRNSTKLERDVQDVWILNSPLGHMLILSTEASVRTFLIANDGSISAAPTNPRGFNETASTICCCNLGDAAVQVVSKAVSKFYPTLQKHRVEVTVWHPKFCRITAAAGNNGAGLMISLSDGKLVHTEPAMQLILSVRFKLLSRFYSTTILSQLRPRHFVKRQVALHSALLILFRSRNLV